MVRNSSHTQISWQLFNQIIGYPFLEAEFQRYQDKFKYLEPKVGKFGSVTGIKAGIYFVQKGKVRLIDKAGELITTLDVLNKLFTQICFQQSYQLICLKIRWKHTFISIN